MDFKLFQSILILFYVVVTFSCTPAQNTTKNGSIKNYDLRHPNLRIQLPYELQEVSGLSYVNDSTIAMVQDEQGILYLYNLTQKKITRKIEFAHGGDYEGVEMVRGTVFVIESNGDLVRFDLNSKDKPLAIKTKLTSKNDVEGLGYDPKSNQLLIACKESPNIKKTDFKGRAIYRFDIEKHELSSSPISIRKGELRAFIKQQELEFKFNEFNPSGIAMHPIEGVMYVLAHGGKLLVGVDNEGQVQLVKKLKGGIFNQPEGICFAPNGDMYIANEGGKDRGTLLKFTYNTE